MKRFLLMVVLSVCGSLLAAQEAQDSDNLVGLGEPSVSGSIPFPSQDFRSCRAAAELDYRKIFDCTKREWSRAFLQIRDIATETGNEINKERSKLDVLYLRSSRFLPDYMRWDLLAACAETLPSPQLAYVFADRAEAGRQSIDVAFYPDSGTFEWRLFDSAANDIRSLILDVASTKSGLASCRHAKDIFEGILQSVRDERLLTVSFIPVSPNQFRQAEALEAGNLALRFDLDTAIKREKVIFTRAYASVSADHPAPTRVGVSAGGPSSTEPLRSATYYVDLIPDQANRLPANLIQSGTFSTMTTSEFEGSLLRALNKESSDRTITLSVSNSGLEITQLPKNKLGLRGITLFFKFRPAT